MADDLPPDDAPLRLAVAVKHGYPYGGMTVSGLRKEIAKGRLEAECVAGKLFVTLRAIREMRERCRVAKKAPTSGSTKEPVAPPCGSSSTTAVSTAQAALKARLQKRKQSSETTSPPSTTPPQQASVHQLRRR